MPESQSESMSQFLDVEGLGTLVGQIRAKFGADVNFVLESNDSQHTITLTLINKDGSTLKEKEIAIPIQPTLGKNDIDRIFNLVG